VCVYYCRTYYKAVRVGECPGTVEDMCYERRRADSQVRPVWMSLPIKRVGQLPVFSDIPDLVCVSEIEGLSLGAHGAWTTNENIRSSSLVRHRNPGVEIERPGGFSNMLTESGNMSIYKQDSGLPDR